ncbi:sigma-70 family RNA polymerase sigma factor [Polyangium sp. y55x31]|uniref:sigma-70 family RNA polymerase sigma factor n=1 Tax=Polyangium sp. y55x31 TaxID=3042688 RepID=UPI002482E95C|nr:sigma-70 family RNA polymerase sigma factor [Polyangium sp. y55x31]MDI1480413.1 sigma-70 family RNA polymerase sigma factor [Polyangium sp. y55x31]
MSGRKTKENDDLPGYLPWMIQLARKYVREADAEDVAIEALRDAYDGERPRPPAADEKRMKGWLGTLIRFRAMAHWRREKKWAPEVLWENAEEGLAVADPIQVESNIEEREWLSLALPYLSVEQREILLACAVEGVSPAAMARERGVNENTFHSWLRRARGDLRRRLEELLDEPRRRLRMLFPFALFELEWAENETAAPGSCPRGRRSAIARIFGLPGRFVASVVAGVFIVGFTPAGTCPAGDERVDVGRQVESSGDVRVVVRVESQGLSMSVPSTGTPAKPPVVMPRKALAQRSDANASVFEDGRDLSVLLQAKMALERGDARGAIALLDEHERRYPMSPNATERGLLRAAAARDSTGSR